MKKVLNILIVASLLTFSFSILAFAGDAKLQQKAPFYLVPNGSSAHVSDELADGNVKLVTPNGKIGLIIQGNIKGLEAKTEYYVWVRDLTGYTGEPMIPTPGLGYYKLVKIKTNTNGHASFHINIKRNELPTGDYVIQVAINKQIPEGDDIGYTVIATQWPGLNVKVASK